MIITELATGPLSFGLLLGLAKAVGVPSPTPTHSEHLQRPGI